jgi:hypothetical protein
MGTNHLCGTQTLMFIFILNVSSITPLISISYQFLTAGDVGRVMTNKTK